MQVQLKSCLQTKIKSLELKEMLQQKVHINTNPKKIVKMSKNSSKKPSLKPQKALTTDQQINELKMSKAPEVKTISQTQKPSSRDYLILLAIFCSIIILMGSFLTYSIYVNMQKVNQKLQKIQLKFHKFLFYIKYIYKNEKQKEQIDAQQASSIGDLITKLTTKDQKQINVEKIGGQTFSNRKKKGNIISRNDDHIKSTQSHTELFSHDQILDIAKQIIEQDQSHQQKYLQTAIKNSIQNHQEIKKQLNNQVSDSNPPTENITQRVHTYNCQIDQENEFYSNFVFDPSTQRLRKSVFTSRFETIICEQPIRNQGIWEMSLKISQTQKSFIYFGIAGGHDIQIYNKTSFHENENYYGYSGFSGRIWQGKKRKTGYEMLQRNTVLRLKVDMNTKQMEYFYNDIKIGQSLLENLCQIQCKFLIEMYNQGDEIEFLHPLEFSESDGMMSESRV